MDNAVEDIKNRLDIADTIQEYVRLTKAGTNYRALCPFHNEKTPSFMVSPDKQIWHCFGCGEGGDIFGFIMKIEGVEFPEALRILASKAGVTLQSHNPKEASQKTKLLDINRIASAYFHKVLLESSQAKEAREYFKDRNVSDDTIELFQLGYSIEGWDDLNNFLIKRGYSESDIFDAGLTVKKNRGSGYYDRFRGRLMFPLSDAHGQIVGFSGRILTSQDEKAAKYVNTPQTQVYNKSSVLYALDKAKQVIQKEKTAVIVEGQMDALASHQIGVENVVASGGTALTEGQVRLLKRYCKTIVFAFDMDVAGAEAARRGLEVAWQYELETEVVVLPFGKDPDECIQKDPSVWKKAITEAKPFMDYYFEKVLKDLDVNSAQSKKQAASLLLPLIVRLPNSIEQTHYIQKLGSLIGVDEVYLRDQLSKTKKPETPTKNDSVNQPTPQNKSRLQQLSELVLGICLEYPEHIDYVIENFKPEYFLGDDLVELYKSLIVYYTEAKHFDLNDWYEFLGKKDDKLTILAKRLCLFIESDFAEIESEDTNAIKKTLIEALPFIKKYWLSNELSRLEKDLKQAEESDNKDQIQQLSEHITSLTEELVKINN
ncbi:DNA primase [Patescibacteria group bacterium]|nr:DNA primase [Patescibacteria group bacterium]MBU1890246.1 DNA primase [Patescibacteria group bacterium]